METVAVLGLAALAWKFTSFAKYLTAGQAREALTQLVTWAAALAAVSLYAHSNFGATFEITEGVGLASLNLAAQVVVAMSLGSLGSAAYDVKKSIDASDSSVEPRLGGA